MRTIVAGSRDFDDYDMLENTMNGFAKCISSEITVVSGTARGADRLGEMWAQKHDLRVRAFPADWNTYGARAGYLRNVQMAEYAEALVAFWDGESKGTKHMIDTALEKGLIVLVVRV